MEIVIILVWIISGVIHYGGYLAFYQRNWPSIAAADLADDIKSGILLSIFGPISLFTLILYWAINGHGFFRHGFKFK